MRNLHFLALAAVIVTSSSAATISSVAVAVDADAGIAKISYSIDQPAIVLMVVKTNGVALAEAEIAHAVGDVRRKVPTGAAEILWAADRDVNGILGAGFTVELVPWPLNEPPEVMVVDLKMAGNFTFYRSVEGLPDGGLVNDRYRRDVLVMRKCPMKGITFLCGKPGAANRLAPYLCTFTNDFYFGIYPVTQAQSMLATGKRDGMPSADPDADMRPVDFVNWIDVRSHDEWPGVHSGLSANGRLGMFQKLGLNFDIPTHAQWECACRAGSRGDTYAADLDSIAWYRSNSTNTLTGMIESHPVGRKAPNAWGLYDMHGNVYEWVLDWYRNEMVPDRDQVNVDPPGDDGYIAAGEFRIMVGGSAQTEAKDVSASYFKNYYIKTESKSFCGYRLCVPAEIP